MIITTCGIQLDTKNIVIFDSGEKHLDRYTVFPYIKCRKLDSVTRSNYIGMSEGGIAVSLWNEAGKRIGNTYYAPYMIELKHLGKRVKFDDLSTETRQHIISRIKD